MTNKGIRVINLRKAKRDFKLHLKNVKRKEKFQAFNPAGFKLQKFEERVDRLLLHKETKKIYSQWNKLLLFSYDDKVVKIPKQFNLSTHYEQCMRAIKEFATSLVENIGQHIVLDFSNCTNADTSALFVLQIIRMEIFESLQILEKKLKRLKVIPVIKVLLPKSKDVIRLLLITEFPMSENDLRDLNDDSTLIPMHRIGYFKGSSTQKHYLENRKTVYSAYVVKYLDSCMLEHGYQLTGDEKNNIDGIIAEVLSNAEDHSGTKNWFSTANFSKELHQIGDEVVGELNLTILNFGKSIYEAFIETKKENSELFTSINNHIQGLLKRNSTTALTEEQLFTLATMQDQVSRLKYDRESRGTGTMKFLNSFIELGDFQDVSRNFVPQLSIYSGKAHLICDNTYKPFLRNDVYSLSLNPQESLHELPMQSHLKNLKQSFPGTLLSVTIYLNKKHMDAKYGGTADENN